MAAAKMPALPHLASALLGHTDPRVTDEHYKRTTSLNAGRLYADLIESDLIR
jgi:integrase